MKVIQYSFPITFTKEQVQLFLRTFISSFIMHIRGAKNSKLKNDSLIIYPLNTWRIIKSRKILLVAKDKLGEEEQTLLDSKLLRQFEKVNLKIFKNEFEK